MRSTEIKLIAIVGPTSSGKSSCAVSVASEFGGEVVSADSRQVYRGLDIGTGKVTKKEMGGIPHHLLDVADPKRKYTVAQFQKKALAAIAGIRRRGKVPILCGGTGLYVQAVVDGTVFPDVRPDAKLRKTLSGKSALELARILKGLDAERHSTIDLRNPRRLIRAIEIAKALGSVPRPERRGPSLKTLIIGIRPDDSELRRRIETRLDARLRRGMIAEAKRLRASGLSLERMRELGLEYRFLAMHLDGSLSKKEMRDKLAGEIWKYAKRQMTWFKKDGRIRWFRPEEQDEIVSTVERFLSVQ